MADDVRDQFLLEMDDYALSCCQINNAYAIYGNKIEWITKNKRKIRVVDMTDEHLQNTSRFLESTQPRDYPWVKIINNEIKRRKRHAEREQDNQNANKGQNPRNKRGPGKDPKHL